jgi:transposase InsO family protein
LEITIERKCTGVLEQAGVGISMDGRGRFLDNIFIERLWRSLKDEDIYLKHNADGREAFGAWGQPARSTAWLWT